MEAMERSVVLTYPILMNIWNDFEKGESMSPIRTEKIESGICIVLEFNEAFNRHDVNSIMRMMFLY